MVDVQPELETTDETDESILFVRCNEICGICGENHRVFTCPKLPAKAPDALQVIKNKGLCTNCLYKHDTTACTSKFTCKKCEAAHHTLLHDAFEGISVHALSMNHSGSISSQRKRALLATALVPVYADGNRINSRALIDPGSTANLLSERGAQLLRCTRQRILSVPMFGVCGTRAGIASFKSTIKINSLYDPSWQLAVDTYKRITSHL